MSLDFDPSVRVLVSIYSFSYSDLNPIISSHKDIGPSFSLKIGHLYTFKSIRY